MVLELLIRRQLSIFEIYAKLVEMPSPRMRLVLRLQSISGLSFYSVMAILSGSKYYTPHIDIQKKIAGAFASSIEELFPSTKDRPGSLAYRYSLESGKQVELVQFIELIASSTHRSVRTVRQWMKEQRIPHTISKQQLATVIGVPIHKLFPSEKEGENNNLHGNKTLPSNKIFQ